jgi:formylglycine-generating enzyme required for sulfatase activity
MGTKQQSEASPAEQHSNLQNFPWDASGEQWPPPSGSGNYAGKEAQKCGCETIDGYEDSYAFTAAVRSFQENSLGRFDLSGNIREWCEDWYNKNQEYRVLRGVSWNDNNPEDLWSSYRNGGTPGRRFELNGFRCVVGAVGRAAGGRGRSFDRKRI